MLMALPGLWSRMYTQSHWVCFQGRTPWEPVCILRVLSLCSFLLSDSLPVIPAVLASLTSELSSGDSCWVCAPCMEDWKLF